MTPREVYRQKAPGTWGDPGKTPGGEEITLSDAQVHGLLAAMEQARANAVRINVREGEGMKTTEIFFTNYSHESGWTELGTMRPSGAYKLDPDSDQWRSP